MKLLNDIFPIHKGATKDSNGEIIPIYNEMMTYGFPFELSSQPFSYRGKIGVLGGIYGVVNLKGIRLRTPNLN